MGLSLGKQKQKLHHHPQKFQGEETHFSGGLRVSQGSLMSWNDVWHKSFWVKRLPVCSFGGGDIFLHSFSLSRRPVKPLNLINRTSMNSIAKKLSQLCTDFAFKLPSCPSRHIREDSHLTSAFPKNRCLFLSIKNYHDAKAHLKSHVHRAASVSGCSHTAPQMP